MTTRHYLFVAAAVASCLTLATVNAQDSGARQFASRTELHPIQTLTISDSQFLKGDEAGAKVVTIGGQLRVAQGTGRLPLVMLIHGSGGIDARVDAWAAQFAEMGVSTFVIDGFTGRGLTGVSTDQALLGRLTLILDAYRALNILAKHPRVDSSRIALMGFSRGGQAALYASMNRFHRMWNRSGAEFAAYVPFYPDCSTTYLTDADVANRPIRIFHGTPDDYNPVAPCKAYVERLRSANRDVQLTEYPNAQHSFDSPLGSMTPAVAKDSQTVRRCSIKEDIEGRLINTATGQPFAYTDSCVERDPHTGYDPVASRSAHQAVQKFLKAVFKLTS